MKPFLQKYLLVTMLALSMATLVRAQDIHFSQIFETPLLRNPALAGLFSGDVRVQTVYRSQWNSVTNAYHTGSVNAEFKIGVGETDDYVTLGGQVLYDKAGTVDLTSTQILPVLNYHKSLSAEKNTYLSMALMAGWVQRSIDRSKITTNSQFNGTAYVPGSATGETFTKNGYGYFDGTAGVSLNTQLGDNVDDNLYIGLAYHHFNKSKKASFYTDYNIEARPKWVASAGIRMSTNDYSYVTFQGDYSKQGVSTEIIGGLIYTQKLDDPDNPKFLIHGGAYMRLKDAIIPVVKVETRPISIAVSYDVNISGLKRVSTGRGGFELSLTYQKFLDKFRSSLNATKCPKF
ncbi:PorP/SprF family type IX secretion system membrane protein [Ferruginibacter yonginensis]|uniref:PorP/SprF family type IX secretion system membrane protein n=1 Tax=Ferruginibacter yonginensis TaxID=1310416 RepID=A0ABV8QRK0_9BACT